MTYPAVQTILMGFFLFHFSSNQNLSISSTEGGTDPLIHPQTSVLPNEVIEIYEKLSWCTGYEVNYYRIWVEEENMGIDWAHMGLLTDKAVAQLREEKMKPNRRRSSGIVYGREIDLEKVENQHHTEYAKFKNHKSIRLHARTYDSLSLWLSGKVDALSLIENDFTNESNQYIIKYGDKRIVGDCINHEIGAYIQSYFMK